MSAWVQDFDYTVSAGGDTVVLTGYHGNEAEVTVDKYVTIDGVTYNVEIDGLSGVFQGRTGLIKVIIGNIIIGRGNVLYDLFHGCVNLEEVDMSACVFPDYSIESRGVFEDCDNLTIIRSPINLNFDVDLPDTFISLLDRKDYTKLPEETEESHILIRKSVYVPVENIVSEESDPTISPGEGRLIKYSITPGNASYDEVIWKSSDPSVATINENGLIIGISPGRTVITGTTVDGGKVVSIVFYVEEATIPVTGVRLNTSSLTLGLPGSNNLIAIISPYNATEQGVSWRSDDPSVATVDQNGKVTAVGGGRTKIWVRTVDGGKEASCEVIVNDDYIPVTDVILTSASDTVKVGESIQINAKFTPTNATDQTLIWSSSNEKVALVDSKGKVTGVGVGTVTISARASNGMTYTIIIIIYKDPVPVTGIKVTPETGSIYAGQSATLKCTIIPSDADDKTVKWSSSDPTIVSVNSKGIITSHREGTATITVTSNDGGFTAVCIVYVIAIPPAPPTYTLYITDNRSNPYYKDMVKARAENLPDNRYLLIRDSDGNLLRPLINGDSTINNYLTAFYYNLRYTDTGGNDKKDYGKVTIRIPVGPNIDVQNGTITVVGLKDNRLDKSLPISKGVENNVHYVTFTTDYFGEFAILYRPGTGVYGTTYQLPYYNNGPAVQVTQNGLTRVLDSIPRTGDDYIYRKLREDYARKFH